MNEYFSTAESTLRERVVDNTTLPGMDRNRGGAPRVDVVYGLRPDGVVLALLYVALGSKEMPVR
jgi:hypothetical protein